MHTYLRNKPIWLQLIIFGGLTAGILLVGFYVGLSVISQLTHLSVKQITSMGPDDYARPENATVIRGLLVVQFFSIFLLPSLVFAYLADPHPLYYSGIRPAQKKSFFLLAVLIMIAAYFTVEFMALINEWIVHQLPKKIQDWVSNGEDDANGTLKSILTMKGPRDLVKVIFLLGILPAIGEEFFFRGILQKLFIQIFKKAWPGIIFTGFLFSAFHMQFMGFLPRMALGIILGALCWYSGSLLTAMIGHFTFNTINVFLVYYNVSEVDSKAATGWIFVVIGLVSMAIVIFLLGYLQKKSTTDYHEEFPPGDEYEIFKNPEDPA